MTTPARQNANRNQNVAVALTAVFMGGAAGFTLQYEAARALGAFRPSLPLNVVTFLSDLVGAGTATPYDVRIPGPALAEELRLANAWLGTYTVAAASRLLVAMSKGPDALEAAEVAERRYFELHLLAEERRQRAAALQDATAHHLSDREPHGLLGWRSVVDNRTTPECRWAHGKNFRADRMPEIGWPGAVHVHCRCSAGPPIPGAPLIPSL